MFLKIIIHLGNLFTNKIMQLEFRTRSNKLLLVEFISFCNKRPIIIMALHRIIEPQEV